MVERMYKKGLVVGIIVLFLGMAFVSSASSLSVEKYVSTDKQIITSPEVEVTWETYNVDGKWYVTFTCDSSEGMNDIDRVEIYIDDELMGILSGPGPEGWTLTIEWSEAMKSSTFKFEFYPLEGDTIVIVINGSDVTPLGADVTWEVHKVDGKWYVTFTCDSDEQLDRIELFINDELIGSGPEGWTFTIEWSKEMKSSIFKFVFYDLEGNTAVVMIEGSDIKSCSISQQFTNLLMLRFLEQFPILQKLLLFIK